MVDVCPICRPGIETAIKSLATIANKSILPKDNAHCSDEDGDTGEMETAAVDDDDDDDDDNIGHNGDSDDVRLTSLANANVDQILQNFTL